MTTFDFIVHSASYSVPSSQCGTVLYTIKYNKVQNFYKKYNILFVSYYSLSVISIFHYRLGPSFMHWSLIRAWVELYILISDTSLGRVLHFGLWYELGPTFMSQFLIWAIPFMGLFHIPISPPPLYKLIILSFWQMRVIHS